MAMGGQPYTPCAAHFCEHSVSTVRQPIPGTEVSGDWGVGCECPAWTNRGSGFRVDRRNFDRRRHRYAQFDLAG
jgi:hypothetical protein